MCLTAALLFVFFFFFNDTATTEIYTLSLHDALPISHSVPEGVEAPQPDDRRLETAVPALRVRLARLVVRQRRDHLHAMSGEVRRDVRVVGEQDGGKVATMRDASPEGGGARHQFPEVAVQLAGPARDVERGNPRPLGEREQ